jgi:hypothetical protein
VHYIADHYKLALLCPACLVFPERSSSSSSSSSSSDGTALDAVRHIRNGSDSLTTEQKKSLDVFTRIVGGLPAAFSGRRQGVCVARSVGRSVGRSSVRPSIRHSIRSASIQEAGRPRRSSIAASRSLRRWIHSFRGSNIRLRFSAQGQVPRSLYRSTSMDCATPASIIGNSCCHRRLRSRSRRSSPPAYIGLRPMLRSSISSSSNKQHATCGRRLRLLLLQYGLRWCCG